MLVISNLKEFFEARIKPWQRSVKLLLDVRKKWHKTIQAIAPNGKRLFLSSSRIPPRPKQFHTTSQPSLTTTNEPQNNRRITTKTPELLKKAWCTWSLYWILHTVKAYYNTFFFLKLPFYYLVSRIRIRWHHYDTTIAQYPCTIDKLVYK